MYDNAFYEYGIPILIFVTLMIPVVGMAWVEWTADWRWERKARKKREAAKAKRQQAAA